MLLQLKGSDSGQWAYFNAYGPCGGVRMDPTNSDPTRVRPAAQEGAGRDPGLPEQGNRAQSVAGHAFVRVLKREYEQFGKTEFVRLAQISVAHLYNLRGSAKYRKQAAVFEPTRPAAVSIGERRKPNPQGRPGLLRVDTYIKASLRRFSAIGMEPRR
jgi:hypothetical protein